MTEKISFQKQIIKNVLLRVNTTVSTTIKYEAKLYKHADWHNDSKIINLQIENSQLAKLLETNMKCYLDDQNGFSSNGIIRGIRHENGAVIVTCDLG